MLAQSSSSAVWQPPKYLSLQDMSIDMSAINMVCRMKTKHVSDSFGARDHHRFARRGLKASCLGYLRLARKLECARAVRTPSKSVSVDLRGWNADMGAVSPTSGVEISGQNILQLDIPHCCCTRDRTPITIFRMTRTMPRPCRTRTAIVSYQILQHPQVL
jgi:hypothetical protein